MKHNRRFGGLLIVAALAQLGCGAEFEPGSRVTDFRLLAVQADAPFAAPGEQVHLRALYHEPFARPVTLGWMTCRTPDDISPLGCLAKIAQDAAASGQPPAMQQGVGLDEIDVTIPGDALDDVPKDGVGNAIVGVVTVACPGTLSMVEPAGTGELPFRCVEAGSGEVLPYERFAVSVKRIFLRRVDRNENPVIDQVTWDGAPWPDTDVKSVRPCTNDSDKLDDCEGGERHRLSVQLGAGFAESGADELGHGFEEQVIVQYYATEGTFEFDVRTGEAPSNRWVARKRAAGQLQTLWFVVRDNRGGVSWVSRQVQVQ
ncbi:MAG: hypothetical protein R3B13_33520 [Polyangiaceae bacterium]